MDDDRKYTLLWIPATGLFYANGLFQDGRGRRIDWSRRIRVWATRERANEVKKELLAEFPGAAGELVVLPVEIEERT